MKDNPYTILPFSVYQHEAERFLKYEKFTKSSVQLAMIEYALKECENDDILVFIREIESHTIYDPTWIKRFKYIQLLFIVEFVRRHEKSEQFKDAVLEAVLELKEKHKDFWYTNLESDPAYDQDLMIYTCRSGAKVIKEDIDIYFISHNPLNEFYIQGI